VGNREVLWYRFAEDNKRDTCYGYCNPFALGSEEIDRNGGRQGGDDNIDGLIPGKNGDEKPPGASQQLPDGCRKGDLVLFHFMQMQRGKGE